MSTQITITDTDCTITTNIETAKQLLFKNSKCESTINGDTATDGDSAVTLVYSIEQLNKLTSLLNHR